MLDALASCHTIAFDKTGTLTTGELKCKAIEQIHGHHVAEDKSKTGACCIPTCEKEALAVAAAMEKGTTHPIGRYGVVKLYAPSNLEKGLLSFNFLSSFYIPAAPAKWSYCNFEDV